MKDVISLGIGEPDFTTPKPILEAGIRSLQNGETHYTSNWGKLELRQAIADNLMVPIPGFKSVQQVKDNAGALEFGPLTEEQVKEIHEIVGKYKLQS